ncbi:unnamed protein product [Calypogeia fissa]
MPRQDSEIGTELKTALEEACLEAGVRLTSAHFSSRTGFWLWEEPDAAPLGKLAGWFASARKRSLWPLPPPEEKGVSESFNSQDSSESTLSSEDRLASILRLIESDFSESSLKERLGKAIELDIRSGKFSWDSLLTVCRTEHVKSSEQEDDMCGAIEVNSGGVVYYSLFQSESSESGEAAACIKFAPSRLATQSELFGLELARHFGVQTPQARVIHNGSSEWSEIIFSVEGTKERMKAEDNKIGENTCEELLEALSINRSLLLMGYIDGGPLLDCPEAFDRQVTAEKTAATLGRVLCLDLVLRNEDRLVCKQLGWRGNHGNLMATKKQVLGTRPHKESDPKPVVPRRRIGGAANNRQPLDFRKQLRSQFDNTIGRGRASSASTSSPTAIIVEETNKLSGHNTSGEMGNGKKPQLCIVAIDSGVPRRPPSSKAEKDKTEYPKFVELLLNDEAVASEILQEISSNKLGCLSQADPALEEGSQVGEGLDQKKIAKAFQEGFRAGAHDMQDLRTFLLKLFRKLNRLLKEFVTYMASIEDEKVKEDSPPSDHESRRCSLKSDDSPSVKEVRTGFEDLTVESVEKSGESLDANEQHKSDPSQTPRTPPLKQDSPSQRESSGGRSRRTSSREKDGGSWSGKLMGSKAQSPQFSSRLTLKLKDVNKSAKVDSELCKELDWWDERIRQEGRRICKEQDFTTGFLDHSSSHSLVDSYELKIRLDHLLERMQLIVHGVQTERPSCVLKFLYIGGALAARSFHTLQVIGITDVLCLCPNESSIQEEYPDSFEFKSFQVRDVEDENISKYFEDACLYIDSVEEKGGTILVHCFEGKSRSAAVVIAYLMLRKGHTLFQAWGLLKAAHPRAQPNDGFMKRLVGLDKQLHGKVSMDWQQKKPEIRMCPICGRSAGISNSSLRQHLRRAHPDVTQVPLTTSNSPEAQQIENATAPLENLLSAVGV